MKKIIVVDLESNENARNIFGYQIQGIITQDQKNQIIKNANIQGFTALFNELTVITFLELSRMVGRHEYKKPIM